MVEDLGWKDLIVKQFGDIFITGFSGKVISSGSFVVDFLTEIGGFPMGAVTEVFGSEGSGKTTLALSSLKKALDVGLPVLFLDYECTVHDEHLKRIGIDPAKITDFRVTPQTMEDGWSLVKFFCEKYHDGVIVVDSVAAMLPKIDAEKSEKLVGEAKVASAALVLSNALKQVIGLVRKSNVALILINQERTRINMMRRIAGGKTTPGGSAVKFYSALRLQLELCGSVKSSKVDVLTGNRVDTVTAIEVMVNIVKNKFGSSYRRGKMYVRMNEGIDNVTSLINVGMAMGVISKKGGYFVFDEKYSGDTLGKHKEHGLERARKFLLQNKEILHQLEVDVLEYLKSLGG